MAVELDNILLFDIAIPITHRGFHALVKGGNQNLFALFFEHDSIFDGIKVLLFYLPFTKQIKYCFITDNPIGFNEIEDQRFFIVMISVQKPDERIKSCQNAGFFYQTVEDAIRII